MVLGDTVETIRVTGGDYQGIALINKSDFDAEVHTPVNDQGSQIDPATGVVLSEDQIAAFKKAKTAKTVAADKGDKK